MNEVRRQIIQKLNMLAGSAKARGSTQGTYTCTTYISHFEEDISLDRQYALMQELSHELAGFQRFADLTEEEDRILQSLFELCR